MARREVAFFALIYAVGALSTFGHFYRNADNKVRLRHIMYAALWPLWCLVSYGIGPTLDAIWKSVWGTDDREIVTFALGLFTSGLFLTEHFDSCSGVARCLGVGLQSVGVGFMPITLGYWAWLVAGMV